MMASHNSEEQTAVPEEVQPEVVEGPGRRLREAREKAGLSIVAIARRLKLNREFIEAVERDEYQSLPSLLFARGYVQSYAKVVELPVDEILDDLKRMNIHEEPPALPNGAVLTSAKRHRERMMIRWGGIAVAVVMAVLLYDWFRAESTSIWLRQVGLGDRQQAMEDSIATQPATDSDHGKEDSSELAASSPPIPEEPPQVAAADAASLVPESAAEGASELAGGTLATVAETPSETEPTPAPEASSETIAVTEPEQAPEPRQPTSAVAANAVGEALNNQLGSLLRLELEEDSWVEIFDATGKRLIFNLLRQGSEHQAVGVAPISVLLGNAAGVIVTFEGEERDDIQPNEKGVARVVLGTAQ